MLVLAILCMTTVSFGSDCRSRGNQRPHHYVPRHNHHYYQHHHHHGIRDGDFHPHRHTYRFAPGYNRHHHFRFGAMPPHFSDRPYIYFGYEIEY